MKMPQILNHSQALAIITAASYLNNVNGTIKVTIKGDDGMAIKVFEWTSTDKHPSMRPGSVRVVLINIDHSTAAIDDYVNWDSFAIAHNV